jgi:hypothetical protein
MGGLPGQFLRLSGPLSRPKNKRNPFDATFHGVSSASAQLVQDLRTGSSARRIHPACVAPCWPPWQHRDQIWQPWGTQPAIIA